MEQWTDIMAGHSFITDIGYSQPINIDNVDQVMGQYAVWVPTKEGDKHQVVEVGMDIESLMQKYGIAPDFVCRISE